MAYHNLTQFNSAGSLFDELNFGERTFSPGDHVFIRKVSPSTYGIEALIYRAHGVLVTAHTLDNQGRFLIERWFPDYREHR